VAVIDSNGIGVLMRHLSAAKKGGAVKLLKPSKFAMPTLKLARVLNRFEVFDDQQTAVKSFT
jgi:hypothetical protein